MDVLHVAMWVEDVESAEAFYTEGLGLERTREFESDDGATNRFVGGESDAEIQFKYYADDGGDDVDKDGNGDGSGGNGDGNDDGDRPSGFDHVAVAVDDIDGSIATLTEEFDSELLKGPKHLEDKGIRIAFVTDPEGYTVELIEQVE
ncbi:lactoylglutathione lyase [Halorubrum sp. 48-1-W]|uniref:VOC family protein n=1 Tax=Halorubrum sp. 48-1-W TaxID=2249761 RepID=UPI000DCB222B|nr:VOC family protein [Halorubrum sp. 48-1-W]RAW44982.1 lactoylglutathione lyase [Halorubrum sp. 48-1-W]